MRVVSVEAPIHGRVLVREAAEPVAAVIGFHGYMESASVQMERLAGIPGSERWSLVSVQGLHRFYRGRSEEVVASWMTRQDREQMIADNVEYVGRAVEHTVPAGVPLVMLGFSQGAAMALRAGVRGRRRASGIAAVGGDVPPELLADTTATIPPTFLLRGERDDWYTAEKLDGDVAALRARNVPVSSIVYPGAHEWTREVSVALGDFIARVTGQ